jgi:hypothetical protein
VCRVLAVSLACFLYTVGCHDPSNETKRERECVEREREADILLLLTDSKTRDLCLGVRGPGIAELCSVVSRVARETQPSIILVGTSAALTRRRAGSVGMLGGGGSNTVLTFLITTPASQAFSLRVAACLPYLPQGQGPRAIDLISYPTRGYVWRVERHHKRVRVVCRLARDGETQRSVTSFHLRFITRPILLRKRRTRPCGSQ